MVRMQDVAERANVSIATVSFVVNGTKKVSDSTRIRVESAMSELGFTRNVVARALASRRSRLIALVFPDLDTRGNWSALQFVHGASNAAAERDHHLILWPVANDPVALREYLDGGLVDGVLAMEVQLEDPRVPVLDASGTPYVLIGRTADTSGYAFADVDFESTTAAALEELHALGHRRVALLLEQPGALGASAYGPPVRVEQVYREVMSTWGEE
ncbi:LacI family DNA-binding transcriptional regulator, partial [Jatrophihabitans endophyticus]|uniref:LacI family DNA-binding transcriptional regulator n=1 Tax=Jatrophihabitans endophyticus TaxID=1206085 RepID=UPI001A084437